MVDLSLLVKFLLYNLASALLLCSGICGYSYSISRYRSKRWLDFFGVGSALQTTWIKSFSYQSPLRFTRPKFNRSDKCTRFILGLCDSLSLI